MKVIEFILSLKHLPMSTERPCIKVTKSEVKRWIKKKSVLINGKIASGLNDNIKFPVWQLVFFPKGKRKCTMQ